MAGNSRRVADPNKAENQGGAPNVPGAGAAVMDPPPAAQAHRGERPEDVVARLIEDFANDEPICARTLLANMVLAGISYPAVVKQIHARRLENKRKQPRPVTAPILEARIHQFRGVMGELTVMSKEWVSGLSRLNGEARVAMIRNREALNKLHESNGATAA